MARAQQQLLTGLLKNVSRSFYLTLRVLPGSVRHQIGLAYLLARTTDTVADTELIAVDQRLQALAHLRRRILGQDNEPLNFGELVPRQASPAEKELLERTEEGLRLLQHLDTEDLQLVREVLSTIISGQELDLRRFADVSSERTTSMRMAGNKLEKLPDKVVALQTESELDDYTYRVAGCVGEFWTKICRMHVFTEPRADDRSLLTNGVRFGKGLQLVNILRDIPEDLRRGRCYLPSERLANCGLTPEDLFKPTSETKLRPLYRHYLDLARSHLAAGWNYTDALPRRCVRIRLACAWPILIGMRNLELLQSANVLDPDQRVKVSRPEVKKIMIQSVVRYPFPNAWRQLGRDSSRK